MHDTDNSICLALGFASDPVWVMICGLLKHKLTAREEIELHHHVAQMPNAADHSNHRKHSAAHAAQPRQSSYMSQHKAHPDDLGKHRFNNSYMMSVLEPTQYIT